MSDVITAQRLTKHYGRKCVVDSVDLRVPQGSVYGLLGRNGAGKSTVIKMLLGMVHADYGRAELFGEEATRLQPATRQRIAYLAENHPLYRWMRVGDAAGFTRSFYPDFNDQLLTQILDHFDLSANARIRRLSNGQRAQVSLALAVAQEPELLILDDPTLGLDTVVRRDFLESLIQIIQRKGHAARCRFSQGSRPMLGSLALKELRETGWIAGIALLIFGGIVATAMGVGLLPWNTSGQGELVPFVYGEFVAPFAFTAAGLALVLGFRQSVGESAMGTFLFLLHRPASRVRLVGTKLAVGLGLCLICSALPILVYAAWAASPGNHPSPFEWSMTLEAWRIWAAMPLTYLGAFLSGIRPGRWYATRLLPLLASGPLVLMVALFPWWPAVVLAIGLLAGVLFVVSILFVAESRDYA